MATTTHTVQVVHGDHVTQFRGIQKLCRSCLSTLAEDAEDNLGARAWFSKRNGETKLFIAKRLGATRTEEVEKLIGEIVAWCRTGHPE